MAGKRKLSAEERAALKETMQDTSGEEAVLEKIAAMPDDDRALAERLHALIRKTAPELEPRTWYGMPAYAQDGKVVCFFQNASRFKARYSTLGFSDKASLDDGDLWPTGFALTKLTPAVEKRIAELVRRAVSS